MIGPSLIELGSEVRDKVSGFKGIAVARTNWLQGCARITVQPQVDTEGKLPESQTFDEPNLETIKPRKIDSRAGTGVG